MWGSVLGKDHKKETVVTAEGIVEGIRLKTLSKTVKNRIVFLTCVRDYQVQR